MRKNQQFALVCGGVSIIASKHPNEMSFKGVLVRLDEPSTKPPNGSEGHRIYVPTAVAKRRLKTLIGMGLNYSPDLKSHAQRRKVGVIKKAWIEGQDLYVSGVVWKHDFPEAEKDLKRPSLGMSMELGKVQVADLDAEIWKLEDFFFLGATILKKDAAAYHKTLAIAAKAEERKNDMATVKKAKGKETVEDQLTPKRIAEIAAAAAVEATKPMFNSINKNMNLLATRVEQIDLAAGAASDVEDEDVTISAEEMDDDTEACGDDMKVKAKATDEDEEDMEEEDEEMESASEHGIEEGDLEDLGPDTADDEEGDTRPGHLGNGAKNKGNKTSTSGKLGKNINQPVTGAAVAVLRKEVKKLNAKLSASVEENTKLRKRLAKFEKQVSAASVEINRRSLSPELTTLLAKASLDADDLRASGMKLSVQDVDAVLNNAGINLEPMKRIELKNAFFAAGLMEEGAVTRGAGR